MTILSWERLSIDRRDVPAALTIGNFDGMHRGHQTLIRRIVEEPRRLSLVVTFRRNPAWYLRREHYLGDIMSLEQKLEVLRAYGVDYVILLDFGSQVRGLTGDRFLDALQARFHLEHLVVGYDFHFGKNREVGSKRLQELGADRRIRVDIVEPLIDNERSISSTRIRECIAAGDVQTAQRLLSRPYTLDVRNGIPGLPGDTEQVLPASGTYRISLRTANGQREGTVTITGQALHWAADTSDATEIEILSPVL
ncbi:MAG: adenylyltransferase/cytidyltransferase family protein [Alkalispirochaetaceae bacterium]